MSTESEDKIEFRVISMENAKEEGNLEIVRDLHGGLLSRTFTDLEELEIWERLLTNPSTPYEMAAKEDSDNDKGTDSILFFIVVALVGQTNKKIVGGVSCELYKKGCFGIMSYLSVEPAFQGKGITKEFTKISNSTFQLWSKKYLAQSSFSYSCILVVQARDEEGGEGLHHEFDPLLRQKIWTKLGFWPINVGLVMPGRLGKMCSQRHQLCIYKPNDPKSAPGVFQQLSPVPAERQQALLSPPTAGSATTEQLTASQLPDLASIPTALVLQFVESLYECILFDEDNFTDENGEIKGCCEGLEKEWGASMLIGPHMWW